MNRGRRTHIHAIQLFEIEPLPKVEVVLTKGRNQQLLHERNQKIVHRYYYKAKLQKMQYETLLTELEQEFNYSKKTIYNILFVEHYELVMEVMRAKPNTQALRKAYPYLVWK